MEIVMLVWMFYLYYLQGFWFNFYTSRQTGLGKLGFDNSLLILVAFQLLTHDNIRIVWSVLNCEQFYYVGFFDIFVSGITHVRMSLEIPEAVSISTADDAPKITSY